MMSMCVFPPISPILSQCVNILKGHECMGSYFNFLKLCSRVFHTNVCVFNIQREPSLSQWSCNIERQYLIMWILDWKEFLICWLSEGKANLVWNFILLSSLFILCHLKSLCVVYRMQSPPYWQTEDVFWKDVIHFFHEIFRNTGKH